MNRATSSSTRVNPARRFIASEAGLASGGGGGAGAGGCVVPGFGDAPGVVGLPPGGGGPR